jgi:hypothetical protein
MLVHVNQLPEDLVTLAIQDDSPVSWSAPEHLGRVMGFGLGQQDFRFPGCFWWGKEPVHGWIRLC